MAKRQFTDSYIRGLKPRDARFEVGEPGGLKMRISPSGQKVWVYVYRQNNKLRRMTLGSYPSLSLADARSQATSARASKLQGEDPAANLIVKRMELRQSLTVNELAHLYIEKYAKLRKTTWKEDERILGKKVKSSIGSLRARDVKRMHIIDLLEDIATKSPISANRTLEVIRKTFNWAIEREIVEINPCWQVSRPSPENQRDRVLNSEEIKTVWNALGSENDDDKFWPSHVVRLSIQLCLLLTIRRSEIAHASVSEFDFDNGWWTIPKERAKNKLTHRVHLSSFAQEILKEIISKNKGSDFLLPSPKHKNSPIHPGALTKATERIRKHIDIPHWVLHDLRRTAASNMASQGVTRLVISKILNHVVLICI